MTYLEMQKKRVEKIESILIQTDYRIAQRYKLARDNVTNLVKDAYVKHLVGIDGADYYKTLNLYNRMKTLNQDIKGVYIDVGKSLRKDITDSMYQVFDDSYAMSQYTTAFFTNTKGLDIAYQPPNSLLRDSVVTGDADRLKMIRNKRIQKMAQGMFPPSGDTLTGMLVDNMNKQLATTMKVVKQGLINGESYVRQAKRLKKVFDGNTYNALRVARTEGNRLLNAGAYLNSEEYKEAGVKIRRQWVATVDERTRESHQHPDGAFEDDDGYFWIGGEKAHYPGDFSDPAETIHCRCTVIDVVEGLEPTLQRGINPLTGKKDIATFSEVESWKKAAWK